jgi:hypothetical protein
MRHSRPGRYSLLLVLLSSVAVARERTSVIRDVVLPDAPEDTATVVYVAGGVASVLRFQQPVDAGKTAMLGWEGRFEPSATSSPRTASCCG